MLQMLIPGFAYFNTLTRVIDNQVVYSGDFICNLFNKIYPVAGHTYPVYEIIIIMCKLLCSLIII